MWTTERLGTLIFAGLLTVGCLENSSEEATAQYRAQILSGNGGTWNGGTWNGGTWNGGTWNGGTWNGGTWNGGTWNGGTWNGGTWNGGTWNGATWNGSTWNGGTWNGGTWNGGTWNGGTWNGSRIDNITLSVEGSLLKGVIQPRNRVVQGADFIGSTFQVYHVISATQKEKFTFRIDDVYLDSLTPANSDHTKETWRYRMSFRTDADQTWRSVCYDEAGAPADLVPIVGSYWNFETGARIDSPTAFTLACKDGALEKCVHLGYRPWGSQQSCRGSGWSRQCSTVQLKEYHQACIRMLRADYCGDGVTHTVDGTRLDVYDYLQPPVQLREENWDIEARWTNEGATCLSTPRHPELWAGGCPDPNNPRRLNKLPKCSPYESRCGMMVSTFDAPDHR